MALTSVNLSPLKSPLSSILPTVSWKMPELTAPAEMMSCNFLIDTPDFAHAAQASAAVVAIDIAMKLLMSLSMWPWPGSPTWIMYHQNAGYTGLLCVMDR